MTVIAYEPRRFESAARYYVEGRPAYSPRLIARIVGLLGLDGSQSMLDLGTGPGQLAVAFAPGLAKVTALDPEPEMLRIAAEQASRAGVRLDLREGSSYSLDDGMGPFDLVTIGRAFHWMDRPATLAMLDRIVRPGGTVALFATRHPKVPDNAWIEAYEALTLRHAEPNSHREMRQSNAWLRHEAVLLDSPFSILERVSIVERRVTPLAHMVKRALSASITSPGRMTGGVDELTGALEAALAPYVVDGMITEVVESEALLAMRP